MKEPYILPVPDLKQRPPFNSAEEALEFYKDYSRAQLVDTIEMWVRHCWHLADPKWAELEAKRTHLQGLSQEDAAKLVNSRAMTLEEVKADLEVRVAELELITAA